MANKTIMIVEDDVLHMKLFNDVLESGAIRPFGPPTPTGPFPWPASTTPT